LETEERERNRRSESGGDDENKRAADIQAMVYNTLPMPFLSRS
jgi:hypothetical protein